MMAVEQEYGELNMAIKMFQDTMMRCRYSAIPVIAAPHGMTLGGGCELVMHSDRAVAAAETYIGLVEFGVGVIPGGGGSKEMALPGWLALVAKAGTPPEILKRLGEATQRCVASGTYTTRMEAINAVPVASTPGDVKAWTDRYSAVFKPLIERLNLAE